MQHQQTIQPQPGQQINLAGYDPDYTGDWEKDLARRQFKDNQERMDALQNVLYAEHKHALLIVLQAMDAGGKDSTIRKVMEGINPQGVHVWSFKQPTPEELDHDFLWRIHQHVPAKGMIGIFNRSHYEDVLVVRVNKLVPDDVWQARYDHINAFERLIADSGVTILKFYLHISKAEQKERFEDRLKEPDKHWKFSRGDLPVRKRWDDYMAAYEDALTRCNTAWAPWYIVPANHKWYRDLVISDAIVRALESLHMEYPAPEPDLDKVKIPD
ncbi:polyphosphate kinase 2 family protein [Aggregatilinea lenta]|uniref:polyphosphate kinase 2 family protein n=1 Tax=Aggregatilinea lenta TaxID=913108 RepID=UPI000E5B67DE|nr:polyphosphate kinase 2 family protein [Aggregatilinea lenta]